MKNFDQNNSKEQNKNSTDNESINEETMAVIIAAVKEETSQTFQKVNIVSIEEKK